MAETLPRPHAPAIWTMRRMACALTDGLVLVTAFLAAVALRFGGAAEPSSGYAAPLPKAMLHAVILQLCLYYSDLYEDRLLRWRLDLFVRTARAFLAGTLVLSALYFALPPARVGRGILLLYVPLALAGLVACRAAYIWVWGLSALNEKVLVLGTGPLARQITGELIPASPAGYRLAGLLAEHPSEVGLELANTSVIGVISELPEHVARQWVTLIVVALEDRRGLLPVADLLRCRLAGVRVEEATTFFERHTGRILVKNLRPSWLVFSDGFRKPRLLRNAKRVGEFTVALALLVLLSPLLALLALLVKLDSRGPAFYRQARVGEGGREFRLNKFRTMRADAEAASGPVWASATGDPRTTRVGRILRKVRLDELPQLINVLRGDMSFVGPRPERPHFVATLRKVIRFYDERHCVKPGITGWAQIKFGYGSNIEDAEKKLQFDLYYIKHMSLLLDLKVVLGTVKVVLLGRGSR